MALAAFLGAIAAPLARKVLTGLGFGIVSFAAISTALNAALDQAKTAWAGLGGDSLSLIQMSGAATALSVIAGALVARVGLLALKRLDLIR